MQIVSVIEPTIERSYSPKRSYLGELAASYLSEVAPKLFSGEEGGGGEGSRGEAGLVTHGTRSRPSRDAARRPSGARAWSIPEAMVRRPPGIRVSSFDGAKSRHLRPRVPDPPLSLRTTVPLHRRYARDSTARGCLRSSRLLPRTGRRGDTPGSRARCIGLLRRRKRTARRLAPRLRASPTQGRGERGSRTLKSSAAARSLRAWSCAAPRAGASGPGRRSRQHHRSGCGAEADPAPRADSDKSLARR